MWQPSASNAVLQARAAILATIRQFFADRQVLEVDTPCLSQATVTDVHLSSFSTEFVGPGFSRGQTLYLQTSPEFAMKRLLAHGSGSIYQIFKAFRNEEAGRFHNPEFTLLEWYRVGFDDQALMTEVDQLLQLVLNCAGADRLSYQQAFLQYLNVDPLTATLSALRQLLPRTTMADLIDSDLDRDTLLQLLFGECIEPHIGQQQPCFIYHFPASQAALAKIDDHDPRVARRFEVYYKGTELANGFYELTDADEQLHRFEQDNQQRVGQGKPPQPIDQHLIAGLRAGLPDCAGVALGIDRLIMLALELDHIDQVIAFTVKNA